MTIKTAADNLLKRKEIDSEEYNTLLKLEKSAALGDILKSIGSGVASIPGKASSKLYNATVSDIFRTLAVATAGGVVAKEGYGAIKQKIDISNSYKNLKDKNPSLMDHDDSKIKDYFDVVKTFSPRAAANPLVAGALVNKMLEYGGVDHKLIQDLANMEPGMGEGAKTLMSGVLGTMTGLSKGERMGSDGTYYTNTEVDPV